MYYFQKAYDSIHKGSVIYIMREFNLNKLIKLVKINISEKFDKVKVGNITTDSIMVKSGLRQGDAMLPILFNIIIEKLISYHKELNFRNHL